MDLYEHTNKQYIALKYYLYKDMPYTDANKEIESRVSKFKIETFSTFTSCLELLDEIVKHTLNEQRIHRNDLVTLYMLKLSIPKFIEKNPYKCTYINKFYRLLDIIQSFESEEIRIKIV